MNQVAPPNIDNPVIRGKLGVFDSYWQSWLPQFYRALMGLYSNRKMGLTAALATGETVAHGMSVTPSLVFLQPQESGPTDWYPSTITATTFTVNFSGGGSHVFGWSAEA